jgi:predicted amidohydrolase
MTNVAVVQLTSTQEVEENLKTIRRLVLEAAEAGAKVVALPENALFLRIELAAQAPAEPLDGPLIGELRCLASGAGVWLIVGSFPEASHDPNRYYLTSVVIDGTTEGAPVTASYRKLHLFDIDIPGKESHKESDFILPGEELVITDIAGIPTGLSICYDLRFPRLYQNLTARGAKMLTVPAAFTEFTGKEHWLTLLRARAIENQCFVIAPNQYGHHGGKRKSFGKSVIFDPWGTPLCIAADRPGWAMARVDLNYLDEVRQSIPCLQHKHPMVQ